MGLDSDVLTIEREGHVATLWLDRPDKRNAMGPDFWADLPVAMTEIAEDAEARVVVLAARGKSFSVGLDLVTMAGAGGVVSATPERASAAVRNRRAYQMVKRLQASITAVADCPVPVIAAVHGHCIGGGIDLISACDIRLASSDAVFSVRETKIAITADVGTLQRLPQIVTAGHVAELAYTGKDIDAARAHDIGLVNDVFDDVDALHDAARAMADEIAANSPLAVQGTKAVLRAGEHLTTEQALDYVALWNTGFLRSDDLGEAMTAFVEKRPPEFRGT